MKRKRTKRKKIPKPKYLKLINLQLQDLDLVISNLQEKIKQVQEGKVECFTDDYQSRKEELLNEIENLKKKDKALEKNENVLTEIYHKEKEKIEKSQSFIKEKFHFQTRRSSKK